MGDEAGHYDRIAGRYDGVFPDHVTGHYVRKRRRLIRLFLAGGLGLDVGCGTGRLMEAVGDDGEVMGVDLSKGMLGVAGDRVGGAVGQARSERLPFADGTFDVVFSAALMHHLVDPARVAGTVREMVRVTRAHGTVIIWDHNPRNPFWPAVMRRAPQDTGGERLVPAAEMRAALEAAGARRVWMFRNGFVPPWVPRWLMFLARAGEFVLEHAPVIRGFAAHNVFIARK